MTDTGDTPRTDPTPALVEPPPAPRATAGELRRAFGYVVDAEVADHQVPTKYMADTLPEPGEVRLVEDTPAPDDGMSPLERLRSGARVATAITRAARAPTRSPR